MSCLEDVERWSVQSRMLDGTWSEQQATRRLWRYTPAQRKEKKNPRTRWFAPSSPFTRDVSALSDLTKHLSVGISEVKYAYFFPDSCFDSPNSFSGDGKRDYRPGEGSKLFLCCQERNQVVFFGFALSSNRRLWAACVSPESLDAAIRVPAREARSKGQESSQSPKARFVAQSAPSADLGCLR